MLATAANSNGSALCTLLYALRFYALKPTCRAGDAREARPGNASSACNPSPTSRKGELSNIPEVSFFREVTPDGEPGDLVAGFFDCSLDLLLLGLPPIE
jgi:hypothetical protein